MRFPLIFFLLLSCFLTNLSYPQSSAVGSDKNATNPTVGDFPPPFFTLNTSGTPSLPDSTTVIERKSTAKAMLFSALVPGLGQIYTKSYWKLPIIWGLGSYYIHEWIKNNNQYRDFRDLYLGSIATSNPQGDLRSKAFRDFYRNQRDSFAWYFGILYLANIVDAYVSASLYEFDVSDDLSMEVGKSGRALTLRWKW